MSRWIKLNDVRINVALTDGDQQLVVDCLMALYDAPSFVLNYDDDCEPIIDECD